ncbi:hypothetical protein SLEP1_g21354 [Rubroshorea leprosula]|uniref:Uncharacterized protein n=1 Tax=Rubroshorea leprosula TaxID=152421 RepID=A0AAV5JB25_9ROSI|nr:hypothetical protein SLEP1_g21354 [Rubroshorea leprosula]
MFDTRNIEAAQKAIEEANTQETTKQQLQALLEAYKQRAEKTKQPYTHAQPENDELTKRLNEEEKKAKLAPAKNGELTKKLEEEEKKAKQLQDSVHRFVADTMIDNQIPGIPKNKIFHSKS